MRHAIHRETNPDCVVHPAVIESLTILAALGYTFDVVAVFPQRLKHITTLSERIPTLKMMIDDLGKYPYDSDSDMAAWRDQMAAAAQNPNVCAKISGLNTAIGKANWSAANLQPAIDFALTQFEAHRLVFGSDWRVALLAGDYAQVVARCGSSRDLGRQCQSLRNYYAEAVSKPLIHTEAFVYNAKDRVKRR